MAKVRIAGLCGFDWSFVDQRFPGLTHGELLTECTTTLGQGGVSLYLAVSTQGTCIR